MFYLNLHTLKAAGIATRYGLDGPGIESRWEARFPAPVQTGPGAHPGSCTMGTGSFPGVKRPWRGADSPHPHLQCRGLKLGRAIPLPTLRAFVACKGGTFTFTFYTNLNKRAHYTAYIRTLKTTGKSTYNVQ